MNSTARSAASRGSRVAARKGRHESEKAGERAPYMGRAHARMVSTPSRCATLLVVDGGARSCSLRRPARNLKKTCVRLGVGEAPHLTISNMRMSR